MIKTIASNEVKQKWGSVMGSVGNDGDIVVVESHGKAKVAVIPIEELQTLLDAKEKIRRADLLAKLRAWEQRVGNRNSDLTEEQKDELANRFAREFVMDLAREGKISFEEELSYYDHDDSK